MQRHIELPDNAVKPTAALTVDGQYFQDNTADSHGHRYWTDVDEAGGFRVDKMEEGAYQLTVYAPGIMGAFILNGTSVCAGSITNATGKWEAESAGLEV